MIVDSGECPLDCVVRRHASHRRFISFAPQLITFAVRG